MTPFQLDVVRVTLHELRRSPERAAGLFYYRLFRQRPGVRPVFGAAFDADGKRLLWILSAALAGLADPQRFLELRRVFARSEARELLADPDDASAIGDALQWMLKHHLGDFYTAEVREAWQAACRRISDGIETGATPFQGVLYPGC